MKSIVLCPAGVRLDSDGKSKRGGNDITGWSETKMRRFLHYSGLQEAERCPHSAWGAALSHDTCLSERVGYAPPAVLPNWSAVTIWKAQTRSSWFVRPLNVRFHVRTDFSSQTESQLCLFLSSEPPHLPNWDPFIFKPGESFFYHFAIK